MSASRLELSTPEENHGDVYGSVVWIPLLAMGFYGVRPNGCAHAHPVPFIVP